MHDMKYPHNLLPIKGWKTRLDIDKICKECCFPIVRRISGSFDIDKDKYFIDLGTGYYNLKLDAGYLKDLQPESIWDMSMNIISDDSPLDNAHFVHKRLQRGEYVYKNWNGKYINVCGFGQACCIVDPCYLIVMNSSNIHDKTFPYCRNYPDQDTFNNEKEFIISLIDNSFSRKTSYNLKARAQLRHDPTPLNYWHIVLDIKAPNASGTSIKHTSSGWQKKVGTAFIQSVINKNLKINESKIPALSRKQYSNSCSCYIFIHKLLRYIYYKDVVFSEIKNCSTLNGENEMTL